MMIIQKIMQILKPYWNEEFEIYDNTACINEVEKLFQDYELNYAINSYSHDNCGYTVTYYVFSWIEDNKVLTFEIIIDEYDEEEINNVN